MVQKPQGLCAAAQLVCVYDFLSNICTPMHSSKSRPQGPSTAAESLEFLRPCVSLVPRYKASLFILTSQTVSSMKKDGMLCLPLGPQAELWHGCLPALSVILGSDLLAAGSDKVASQDGSFPMRFWGPYLAILYLSFLTLPSS